MPVWFQGPVSLISSPSLRGAGIVARLEVVWTNRYSGLDRLESLYWRKTRNGTFRSASIPLQAEASCRDGNSIECSRQVTIGTNAPQPPDLGDRG